MTDAPDKFKRITVSLDSISSLLAGNLVVLVDENVELLLKRDDISGLNIDERLDRIRDDLEYEGYL